MSTVLRVLIADDNPVVRAGLTALLTATEGIEVVAEAADGREALRLTRLHAPEVVLLDVRMPGVDGISALPHLVRLAPVLMLTYSRESEIVREALLLGAGGYLVHGEFTPDDLIRAVRDVREGRPISRHRRRARCSRSCGPLRNRNELWHSLLSVCTTRLPSGSVRGRWRSWNSSRRG